MGVEVLQSRVSFDGTAVLHRAIPTARLQERAFGGRPRDGGVAQGLVQRAVPEQRVMEDPVYPVSQSGDR